MEEFENYYETLQVAERASPEVIRGAYRSLCQKWHPDKNPQRKELAEKMIRRLNGAYEVLSDPPQRRKLDARLASRRKVPPPVRKATPPRPLGAAHDSPGPRSAPKSRFGRLLRTLSFRRAYRERPLLADLIYLLAFAVSVSIALTVAIDNFVDDAHVARIWAGVGCLLVATVAYRLLRKHLR